VAFPSNYIEWLRDVLVPGFFSKTYGRLYWQTIGYSLDILLNGAKWAVKVRFPSIAPEDALDYVGDGRNVDRYCQTSTDVFRDRVSRAWDLWFAAGSKALLETDVVEAQEYENVRIYAWRELEPSVPAEYANWWSGFWVFIGPPTTVTAVGTWGDSTVWGDIVSGHDGCPDGVGVWGAEGITTFEVEQLRGGIRKWKQGHEICAEIVFISGEVWEDVPQFESGTWGGDESVRIRGRS
jgi:hypothetical protein